jgi:hypothetical protein
MSLPYLALAATTALAGAEAAEEKAPPIIDIDGTVLIQFALFVAMFLVLRAFLFKPYLKMRAERAERIEGAEAKAGSLSKRADELEAQYKAKVARDRAAGAGAHAGAGPHPGDAAADRRAGADRARRARAARHDAGSRAGRQAAWAGGLSHADGHAGS